jgi:hypothetical protein
MCVRQDGVVEVLRFAQDDHVVLVKTSQDKEEKEPV